MAPEDDQAAAILAATLDVLGTNVLAIYLYGSAVAGGLRRRSDLDLFALLDRPMTPGERRDLLARLVPLSRMDLRPPSWRPVELTAAVRDEIVPWRYPPRHEFQYGEWLRDDFQRGRVPPAAVVNPDLAVLVTTVLDVGRPLLGPPPAALLDHVPGRDVRRGMMDALESLLSDLHGDERNVILTLARIWTTLVTGEIRSKDAAAEWALARLAQKHRPVLERARAIYLDQAEDSWDGLDERIGPFVDHVVSQIRAVAPEA